jgi:oxygenase catalysing oxidative methylation of damaged DNA
MSAAAPVGRGDAIAESIKDSITLLLDRPGIDFYGGELILVEQRPRRQSRPMVVKHSSFINNDSTKLPVASG